MASSFTKKIFRLVDPILPLARVIYSIPNYIAYFKDYSKYKVLEKNYNNSPITLFPSIHEKSSTHEFDAHYQFQSIWAGEKILAKKVDKHYDIASQMNFGLMLSLSVPVEFMDYRKLDLNIINFNCVEGSLLALPYSTESISSLSCLHVIEHIGLGRYGDPLSASGTNDSAKELSRVLKRGGDLYVSTPVGYSRIEFNSHRIHTPQQIIEMFGELNLVEFSVIDDNGKLLKNKLPANYASSNYSCGLFHFTKK